MEKKSKKTGSYQHNSTDIKRGPSSSHTSKESEVEKEKVKMESHYRTWRSGHRSYYNQSFQATNPDMTSSNTHEDTKENDRKKLLEYTLKNYGTVDLSIDEREIRDVNYKLHVLYEDVLIKRQVMLSSCTAERLRSQHPYYMHRYDACTSEKLYKLRKRQRAAIEEWESEFNKLTRGKYELSEFLTPLELKKFKETTKRCKEYTFEDYKSYKLNRYIMDAITYTQPIQTEGYRSRTKSYRTEDTMPPPTTHSTRHYDKRNRTGNT